MAVAPSPGALPMQAAAVQDIQNFSFKGYDQQPPGFSKPGFCFFAPEGARPGLFTGRKALFADPLPRLYREIQSIFGLFYKLV